MLSMRMLLLVLLAAAFQEGRGREYGLLAEEGPDIVILHPANDSLVECPMMIAFYVSSFCVQRLGSRLTGVYLYLNQEKILESDLLVHGNDGSAQYHAVKHACCGGWRGRLTGELQEVPQLRAGVYEVHASLRMRQGSEHLSARSAVTTFEVLAPLQEEEAGGREGGEEEGEQEEAEEELEGRMFRRCAAREDVCREEKIKASCNCTGDWFGDDCNYNFMVNSSYFPGMTAHALETLVMSVAVHLKNTPCSCRRVSEWYQARRVLEVGCQALGAQMHFLALGLSAALRKQRALVFDEDRWLYGRHENCKGRGRRCFFLSLFPSGCSRDSILAASNSSISRTRGWEAELQSTKETHIDVITTARHLREGLLPPPAFSHLGLFWWRSSLLSILTRKSFYLESLLREAKASMGWPEEERRGILGVHSASRPLCMPTNLYLNAIATMVSKYEFTAIFLATDSKSKHPGSRRRSKG
ncbi:hypothetical protein GUITHDRAFT_134283 [Guillardia theta CCMP2712]|uniref:EGF-like domain-containing protein n=1 Tax=Guillardia theta (strain CCMP2712) TaxID=905079 RepID=L1JTS8_GUITC|nr:hypothetical protein GUITHDRAFT_134283 [Guillardia theta CCMP2712]EKX51971.1 hypothetical protein GUITHDRAFT_134283 [Guillardia theta CCMP2712]|eukprot:XP_005838951.1 hypothetical protein GUITHDRAFT_134283 [Guillardia theta CCMP2712]